jgi:hypothetical protein
MKGNDLIKVSDGEMNADEYFRDLTAEFSNLKDKLNEWDSDMIFFKMEMFAEYSIDQIKSGNKEELNKCLDFQESKIDYVDSLLLNAMTVSYCEALLLGECGQQMDQVVDLMGPKLKKLYMDYETYYNNLGKKK